MVELVAEVGYERATVRELCGLAGVSTATLYRDFPNLEACFASTYDSLVRRALRRARRAQASCSGWEEGLQAALRSLMQDAAGHPKEARLVVVEAFATGPRTWSRMKSGTSALERLLGYGAAVVPPPVTRRQVARGIAAGLTRVTRINLQTGRSAELRMITSEFEDWALSLFGEEMAHLERLRQSHLAAQNGHGESPASLSEAIRAVAGDERTRILTAAARLSLAGGFSQLTVPRIRAQAGVSGSGFSSRFVSVQDCFLEAIEAITTSAAARAQLAADRAGGWEAALQRMIQVLCAEAACHPDLARLALVDISTTGRAGLDRRERMVSLAADCLRAATPPGRRPNQLAAEASAAAAWTIAQVEVEAGRVGKLPGLAPLLTFLFLAPVIGVAVDNPAAARARPTEP